MVIIKFIWRVYGWAFFFIITLLLYPFLFVSTLSDRFNKFFYFFARIWGGAIFTAIGFYRKIEKESDDLIDYSRKYIIVPNHTSFIDIFLIYFIIKTQTVFMGKKELANIPIFGRFYRRTNILVDRKSVSDRLRVYKECKDYIDKGRNICIFPEGGIPKDYNIRLGAFKDGAFALAKETNTHILPITFPDNKFRYPYSWRKGRIGRARVFIHKPIDPQNYTKEQLRDKVYNIIDSKLQEYGR